MRRTSSAFFLAAAFLFGAPAQAGFQEGFDAFRDSDYSAAMAELLPAAERGDAGAAILVGILYANGYGLDGPDFDQSKHWFETAAVAGPTPVMVVKGALMGMRRKADQEFAAALAHFGADAAAGEPGAQYLMAWISNNGVGTATDEIAGLAYLRDAASGGYAQAKFQLAELMLDGLGVPRDETGAAQMFGEAAESGHAASQNALALLYVTGRGGVAQDLVESAEWAIKSGRQGNADAQLFISGLYRDGLGLDQDDAQAFNWAVLAANQNFGPAQLRLASYYADGLGVEADIHEAYFWWALGTLNAYGEYSPLIESLREDLIPIIPAAQRADLDRQAFNWLGIFEGAIDPDVDPLE